MANATVVVDRILITIQAVQLKVKLEINVVKVITLLRYDSVNLLLSESLQYLLKSMLTLSQNNLILKINLLLILIAIICIPLIRKISQEVLLLLKSMISSVIASGHWCFC